MSFIQVGTARRSSADEPVTEELRVGDFLGLAGYLAEAVTSDEVTIDIAREELAGSTTDPADTRALNRAAARAASQLGTDALVTALLHAAVNDHAAGPAAT